MGKEIDETLKEIDETVNVGSEVTLAAATGEHGEIVKTIRIGTIGLIRKVRSLMKDTRYTFSASIGREKWNETDKTIAVDWPAVESTYREAFNLVLVEGLSDEEYDRVDEQGIKELDTLLDRFL
ncbi:hypothetical protein [Paenibacillus sp. NPDC058177]|uniref:hypothetical protein n=1 Tax=Paenibacillus sp. NPDC058177 TaxID=3346369 RepID=UPI0036DBF7EE